MYDISNELHEYIKDTGFILIVLDSMSLPVLTKKSKHKIKELKNVEEHIFHPGGNSNLYCSMMMNMPLSYTTYPLLQTSDRTKNRLAVFAVKLRESFKAYLSDKGDWPTSYYSELLLDTLLGDLTPTEVKDLDVCHGRHEVQEQVCSVSYKITTDDEFLQNMMRSVDALPARTEANLESINGRTAEFFKTSVLYARRKLIPRLSFQTSVVCRGTYGRKIPLSAMDDSCMILWWVKNKRPYQLFVAPPREFMGDPTSFSWLLHENSWETLPAFRGFSTRIHGCAETHASVKDLHGDILVRQNIRCGARWPHYARLSHSRAR